MTDDPEVTEDPNVIRPGESFEDWLERLSREADERCAAVRKRRREAEKQRRT